MKGVIFTEFLEMVEQNFGLEMVDRLVTRSDMESNCAYTSVGTYDHAELVELVVGLSEETDASCKELVFGFAQHLFASFTKKYSSILGGINSSFELLESIEGFIHVEVRKLYPDAELPEITFTQIDPNHSELIYRSARPFADLCEGLIRACGKHYGEALAIERTELDSATGSAAKFEINLIS